VVLVERSTYHVLQAFGNYLTCVQTIVHHLLQVVWPDQSLGETLKLFKQGKGHMAIVRDVDNSGPVSIHTHIYIQLPLLVSTTTTQFSAV
jgi:hypothetical protein